VFPSSPPSPLTPCLPLPPAPPPPLARPLLAPQPKQIKEIKDFLMTARRKDAKSVKIKKTGAVTKFKVSPTGGA
jgi:hypothetical protein